MTAMSANVQGVATITVSTALKYKFTAAIAGRATETPSFGRKFRFGTTMAGKAKHTTARITVLRHRILPLAVNVGAYADKSFSTTLTSASGPGIRQIGELQEQIRPQTANYV